MQPHQPNLTAADLQALSSAIIAGLTNHDSFEFVQAVCELASSPGSVKRFAAAWIARSDEQPPAQAADLEAAAVAPPSDQPTPQAIFQSLPPQPIPPQPDPILAIAAIDDEIKRLKLSVPSGATTDTSNIAGRLKDLYEERGRLASQLGPRS